MTPSFHRVVWPLAVAETIVWAAMYYAFPALLPAWEQDLGWSKTELSATFTLSLAVSALLAPVAGRLIDHGRGRPAPRRFREELVSVGVRSPEREEHSARVEPARVDHKRGDGLLRIAPQQGAARALDQLRALKRGHRVPRSSPAPREPRALPHDRRSGVARRRPPAAFHAPCRR